ncbi:sensor histidine kinase [Nocardioides euryhalodurans]|uniref:histidine kinase n=1 Tax=Nocardioides euryhalodurans TaxID=2518370 RepID=A0A4P7GKI6_9ACTN|nr:histidine kinase [Nocardioides euryhalodurans]QBR92284.1 histidine kinase, dimerization and phosphoacceptor region [Nocardioides euryhalodurans]
MRGRAWLSRHRDPVIAALAAVGLLGELAVYDAADLSRAAPLAAVAAGALMWRRTQPVPAFLATWLALVALTRYAPGIDNSSTTFVLIFFITLFSLGAHTRGLEVVVAVPLVCLMTAWFVLNDGDPLAAGDIVFGTLFVGGPWATGLALRLRGDLARANRELVVQQEERAARAVAEERSRIARELHDVVSHAISVTVLQARGARRTLDSDPEAARHALDAIEQTNTAALGDMRRLLAVLRDTEPDGRVDPHAPQPSLAHLDDLVDHVRAAGVPVALEVSGVDRDVPPGVDLSAYRIVQEALTNVLKHAEASPTRIRLEYAEDALTVLVVDEGSPRAMASGEPPGHGLIGIRERVAVVGGDVEAGPNGSGGFRVRARLPYSLEDS